MRVFHQNERFLSPSFITRGRIGVNKGSSHFDETPSMVHWKLYFSSGLSSEEIFFLFFFFSCSSQGTTTKRLSLHKGGRHDSSGTALGGGDSSGQSFCNPWAVKVHSDHLAKLGNLESTKKSGGCLEARQVFSNGLLQFCQS